MGAHGDQLDTFIYRVYLGKMDMIFIHLNLNSPIAVCVFFVLTRGSVLFLHGNVFVANFLRSLSNRKRGRRRRRQQQFE